MFDYYKKAILLFQSELESYGLPLLEARLQKIPIIASNTEFSQEVLKEYKRVKFFPVNDYEELTKLMI